MLTFLFILFYLVGYILSFACFISYMQMKYKLIADEEKLPDLFFSFFISLGSWLSFFIILMLNGPAKIMRYFRIFFFVEKRHKEFGSDFGETSSEISKLKEEIKKCFTK